MELYYILFVFFFKQKTAYEMRISDWSSDVCSSDLVRSCHGRMYGPIRAFLQKRDPGGNRSSFRSLRVSLTCGHHARGPSRRRPAKVRVPGRPSDRKSVV